MNKDKPENKTEEKAKQEQKPETQKGEEQAAQEGEISAPAEPAGQSEEQKNEHIVSLGLLVGIGASAGGLEAISKFLDHFENSEDITLFVVQHQAQKSDKQMLSNLIKKHTQQEVHVAEDGQNIELGGIYVAPPGKLLAIFNNRLQLVEREKKGISMDIDYFLRSLAQEAEDRAAAIILSGSNTDGTLGARAIKEHNGLVIAQDPDSAEFKIMPQRVIDEELADLILKPEQIPEQLASYARKTKLIPIKSEAQEEKIPTSYRDKLLMLLKNRTGHDFSLYKENTINRRIQRRMTLYQIENLKDYLRYVRDNQNETHYLFKDLLIGVTNFFREPLAFEALKELLINQYLPNINRSQFRAWVPGCATGEEAYSIAILIQEALAELDKKMEVMIYASDLDEGSIEQARKGQFYKNIEDDVSQERLKKYFYKKDHQYYVKKDIRDLIVFAVQNVLKDPPFSKQDLICCRNMLMYMKPEAQKKVLYKFQYSLQPGGLLFLGISESVSSFSEPFARLDKKNHIYKLKPNQAKTPLAEDMKMPEYSRRTGSMNRYAYQHKQESSRKEDEIKQTVEDFLLQTVEPAALVTRSGEVLYFHGRTGMYLEPAKGHPHSNILEMARKGLHFYLSTALSAAAAKREPQNRRGIKVQTNNHEELVDLQVSPVHVESYEEPCFMVLFFKCKKEEEKKSSRELNIQDYPEEARQRIRELEEELQHNRKDMQSVIEDYEAANEELKSSNEELQSTNEELKSTNEELETAKEELQSINEEQNTLNAELQEKNKELNNANDDLQNLMAGTRIATLFLDNELCIRRFTPAIKGVMGLRESDQGRPVNEISMKLEYKDLENDAAQVLEDLNSLEREVKSEQGNWYQLRIVPYRTTDNVIDGVVVTFNDITSLKRSEQESEEARKISEAVFESVYEPIVLLDEELNLISVNKAFLETFKVSRQKSLGYKLYDLGNRQWDIPKLRKFLEDIIPKQTEMEDFVVEHDFQAIGHKRMYLNARAIEVQKGQIQRILLAMTRIEDLN